MCPKPQRITVTVFLAPVQCTLFFVSKIIGDFYLSHLWPVSIRASGRELGFATMSATRSFVFLTRSANRLQTFGSVTCCSYPALKQLVVDSGRSQARVA